MDEIEHQLWHAKTEAAGLITHHDIDLEAYAGYVNIMVASFNKPPLHWSEDWGEFRRLLKRCLRGRCG